MTLNRRGFLKGSAAIGAGAMAAGLVGRTTAAEGTLDVFFNSDTNVVEFWASAVKPAFEAAHADFEALPVSGLLDAAQVKSPAFLCQGDEGRWLRLWPHRHATDGFFAAVWRKKP